MRVTGARAGSYVIYGVIAALVAYIFEPIAFTGLAVGAGFALFMAAAMYAGNLLEVRTFNSISADKANSLLWRWGLRFGIYMLLPMLALVLFNTVVPGVLFLPNGGWTALSLVWMPAFAGQLLNMWPVS